MNIVIRLTLLFMVFLTSQAGIVAATNLNNHQYEVNHNTLSEEIYGYDVNSNSRYCCQGSSAVNTQARSFLPFVSDFLATKSGASSAKQAANLKEHLRQADKYGQSGFKELQNGKNRYYGNVSPADKPGEMAGRRTVREWGPATGNKKTWHETADHNGNVRIVRPQRSDNAKTHYQFDSNGNYTGKF